MDWSKGLHVIFQLISSIKCNFRVKFDCSKTGTGEGIAVISCYVPPVSFIEITMMFIFHFRKCLKSKYAETEREYSNVTQALKAYESVGMGFDSLVNEYSRLRNEVENKQWALSEFQQSLEHTDR